MLIIPLALLVVALVFFGLATAGVPAHPRFAWLPAGLFVWLLEVVLTSGGKL